MDYLSKFKKQSSSQIFIAILLPLVLVISTLVLCTILSLNTTILIAAVSTTGIISALFSSIIFSKNLVKPLEKVQQVVSYSANPTREVAVPDIESLKIGRELILSLSRQIYDLASSSKQAIVPSTQVQTISPDGAGYLNHIALPIIGIDQKQVVMVANRAASEYIGKPVTDIVGKPLFDLLQLTFQDDETFEAWLTKARESSVTSTKSWQKVKHTPAEGEPKQFDLVASFSSGDKSGTETMLVIHDRSDYYSDTDNQVGFVALAVHELRTPLTIMRGYIEVFEDELGPTLTPELTQFMHKMHASAQQLTAFVGNILNVARIEENQLALKLRSESWPDILNRAVEDLQMRAHVHGKNIELQVAQNLPSVAVDRISIHEVLNNLVDNAIKYSAQSDKILITSQINSEGLVETSVQDFGIGIPEPVMKELFKKFYRSHKSNVHIGGTGLGLYLCKALVNAHGGNIWVRSHEGEGSIFSFTILPYDQLSEEQRQSEDGIIRGAHGWIKNHSLYRQ